MSGSRRLSANPIIMEVKPSNIPSIAPSTPPMAKAVRFPNNTSDLVTGVTRPVNLDEAWPLYYFETHAGQCASCADPMSIFRRKKHLCDYGFDLARNVAKHVYYYDGQYYSTQRQEDGAIVTLEIEPDYKHVRSLLKALDQQTSSSSSQTPAIHYETYPVTAPKTERRKFSSGNNGQRPQIILESGSSRNRKSVHRTRYATVVVDENPLQTPPSSTTATTGATTSSSSSSSSPSKTERRGTLYEKDMQRKEKAYRVEIREPENRRDRVVSGENRYYL